MVKHILTLLLTLAVPARHLSHPKMDQGGRRHSFIVFTFFVCLFVVVVVVFGGDVQTHKNLDPDPASAGPAPQPPRMDQTWEISFIHSVSSPFCAVTNDVHK